MSASNYYLETLFRIEEQKRPWHAIVGMVGLIKSPFVQEGVILAMDTTRVLGMDSGISIVVHSKDVDKLRRHLEEQHGRKLSDAEFAAILWWNAKGKAKR